MRGHEKVENYRQSTYYMERKKLKFHWLDVFTDRPLEGNQLAIFPDASGLSADQMQMIAKEMNLSETTFITGSRKDQSGNELFTVRIFTTVEELPFAGHPTLGTSYLLRHLHGGKRITLDLKVGPITVDFDERGGRLYGEMTQRDPVFGNTHDRGIIAEIFGVDPEDLDSSLPIQTVSTGNPFIIVPFRKLSVLERVEPDFSKMEKYLAGSDAKFIYTISLETVQEDAAAHARMIFYGGEDPATGSAAGPAAAWLLKYGAIQPEVAYYLEQGLEMGRPSRIFISGSMASGNPVDIKVGGFCEFISEGELQI